MGGENVFAFTGTAFVPTNRDLTLTVKARKQGSSVFETVPKVFSVSPSVSSIWDGYPPAVQSLAVSNPRTGTFPNLKNNLVLSWSIPTNNVISGFDVFYNDGSGYTKVNTTPLSNTTTSYTIGEKPVGVHRFYIKTLGINGLPSTTSEVQTTLSAPELVSVLTGSKTTMSSSVSWTVAAGVYQRFHVYNNNTYLGEVLATAGGTSYSFTRSDIGQNVATKYRVYGQNYDGFFGSYRELDVTTDTLPIPSISWSDNSATRYSNWSITWTGTTGITYQPQYYVTSWLDNGSSVSGSGEKTSDERSVAYNSTLYMRVYVTDQYGASGYTSQIYVTAGRPLVTETSWKTGSATDYQYEVYAGSVNWGNRSALSFTTSSTIDYKFNTITIYGRSAMNPAKAITLTDRRVVFRNEGSDVRIVIWDDTSSMFYQSATLGSSNIWHTSEGTGTSTYNFGVGDATTYWNNGAWRYANVSNGTIDNWNGGAASYFKIVVNATRRDYTTTTTQTQVNSTYG